MGLWLCLKAKFNGEVVGLKFAWISYLAIDMIHVDKQTTAQPTTVRTEALINQSILIEIIYGQCPKME